MNTALDIAIVWLSPGAILFLLRLRIADARDAARARQ